MHGTQVINVPIGDWSDDGHGKCDHFKVVIPAQFDSATLYNMYNVNKEKLGFGLRDFAQNYEDSIMSLSQWNKLLEEGFEPNDSLEFAIYGDTVTIYPDTMLAIVMFFVGHGLGSDFWYTQLPVSFDLITGRNRIEISIGYGLYY